VIYKADILQKSIEKGKRQTGQNHEKKSKALEITCKK
jgi:hypothetical protein